MADYIKQVAILYGVKVAKSHAIPANRLDNELQHSSTAPATLHSLIKCEISYDKAHHPKIFKLIETGTRKENVRLLDTNDNEGNIVINPSERISAKVHFPNLPNKSDTPQTVQKACWLQSFESTIDKNFTDLSLLYIYMDGSHITISGKSGCGLIVYDSQGAHEIFKEFVAQLMWTTNTE